MKILIDMNLSPHWVDIFSENNIEAVHWSYIGSPDAPDNEIMDYAKPMNMLYLPMILILAPYLP